MRLIGLEPTRRKTPDPKSGAATNYATGADKPIIYHCERKDSDNFDYHQFLSDYFLLTIIPKSIRKHSTMPPLKNQEDELLSILKFNDL